MPEFLHLHVVLLACRCSGGRVPVRPLPAACRRGPAPSRLRPDGVQPLPARCQGLGEHTGVGHRGHEVGVALPPGSAWRWRWRGMPRTGGLAQIGPEIDPLGPVGRLLGRDPRRVAPRARRPPRQSARPGSGCGGGVPPSGGHWRTGRRSAPPSPWPPPTAPRCPVTPARCRRSGRRHRVVARQRPQAPRRPGGRPPLPRHRRCASPPTGGRGSSAARHRADVPPRPASADDRSAISSRSREVNSATGTPRSGRSLPRRFTPTVPAATSSSPTTRM